MCVSCSLQPGEMCACFSPAVPDESHPDQTVCQCDLTSPMRVHCLACNHDPA